MKTMNVNVNVNVPSLYCLAFWTLFGSLAPAIWSHTSCAQVHDLAQSNCGDDWEGMFFS